MKLFKRLLEGYKKSLTIEKIVEILDRFKGIRYGYITKDDEFRGWIVPNKFYKEYIFHDSDFLLKHGYGVCWDTSRALYEALKVQGFKVSEYYFQSYNKEEASHSFVGVQLDGYIVYVEHSWGDYRGVHKFKNEEEMFETLYNQQMKQNPSYKEYDFRIWRMDNQPSYGSTCKEYKEVAIKNPIVYKRKGGK